MIFDFHNDILTAESKQYRQPLFDQNTVYAIWTTALKNPAAFILNVRQNRIRLTAVEDLGFMAQDDSSTGLLAQLRPVYASLTWNQENAFAGGAITDAGLTEKGKKMIARLESLGILLDTAHLSRQAFFEAAEVAQKPFICSHTCFDGVHSHGRNVTEEQIETLIAKGGLIGLCLVSEFMGKKQADADDVVRQIDYFTQKFGDTNLGLGTDFNGCDAPAVEDYQGFNCVAEKLLKRGYTQNSIDKIFYLNARDFLTQRGIL